MNHDDIAANLDQIEKSVSRTILDLQEGLSLQRVKLLVKNSQDVYGFVRNCRKILADMK